MVKLFNRLKIHYAWAILAGCFILSIGGTAIVVNSIGVFIKPVSEAMGFSRASFALFYTFSTLVSTCMAPFLGSLVKRVGAKKPLIVCSIGAGVMIFSYSLCRELYHFYLCGCLAGLFTGALTSMVISSLIYRWFDQKRGLAIGIAFAGSGIGSMVLNPLVSHIIETIGWQTGFQLLGALLIAVNLLACLVFIIDEPARIGLKPFGAEEGPAVKKVSALNIRRMDAMKLPAFWVLCAASCLAGLLGTGIQQHINAYLTDIGHSAAYAATIFSTVMLLLTIGKLLLGMIMDRSGIRAGTAIICALLSISAFMLLLSGQGWMPWVFAFIFGGGYTILSILPTTLTSSLLGTADYSANYGIVSFFLCSGMAVGENIEEHIYLYADVNDEVIRPLDRPFYRLGGLAIMRGNLAPNTGVAKPAAIAEEVRRFTGEAICFDSEEECHKALEELRVKPGHVVVIRYEGPKGGPGMREMYKPLKLMNGQGLALTTALITGGRFSGTNNGCFVGHISPEAAEGGPIALIRDGDKISIDTYSKELTLHVSDEELARRRAEWRYEPKELTGYLAKYAAMACSANRGGVLDWRKK